MTTTAHVGPGFILAYEDPDSPGSWTDIGQVRDIDGPSVTTGEHDVTTQDTVGNWRENIPGLKDGGTVSFDAIGRGGDTGQGELEAIHDDRSVLRWRITIPAATGPDADDTVYGKFFFGFINQLGNTFPLDGVWITPCQLRVSGAVVTDILSS